MQRTENSHTSTTTGVNDANNWQAVEFPLQTFCLHCDLFYYLCNIINNVLHLSEKPSDKSGARWGQGLVFLSVEQTGCVVKHNTQLTLHIPPLVCCYCDDIFWPWISISKLIKLAASFLFDLFVHQRFITNCKGGEEITALKVYLRISTHDMDTQTHTHSHILFKSAAGWAGTCMIAGGEDPAAFMAITEMLATAYET